MKSLKLPIKFRHGLDALVEIIQPATLVGRMDGVLFQAKTHKDGLDAQYLFEGGNDGDAPSPAYGQGLPSEGDTYGTLGTPVGREVDGAYIAFASMRGCHLDLDIFGGHLIYIVDEKARNRLVLLVRNQAA